MSKDSKEFWEEQAKCIRTKLQGAISFGRLRQRMEEARYRCTNVEGKQPNLLFVGRQELDLLREFSVVTELCVDFRATPKGCQLRFCGFDVEKIDAETFFAVGFKA